MIKDLDKKSIDGLYFSQTCLSFPKKYDVYDENNNVRQIAHIIEYETGIQIRCPNEDGKVIYEVETEKDKDYRDEIIKAIYKWCNDTGR